MTLHLHNFWQSINISLSLFSLSLSLYIYIYVCVCVCVYIRKDHIYVCVWLCGIQFCVVFNIFVDIFSQYWRTMTHTTFYVAMVLSMGRRERAPRCGCVPLNPTPTGQVLCVVHELNPRYCVLSMNPAPGTVCCPWIHPQVLHIVHEPSPRYCVLSMTPTPGTVWPFLLSS